MDAYTLGISSDDVKDMAARVSGRKVRDDDRLFVCEGLWAVEKLISQKITVEKFIYSPDLIKENEQALVSKMANYAKNTYTISPKTAEKISDRSGADYAFILAERTNITLKDLEKNLKDNMTVMILDGQEQPGNMGAILRSLDCAGGDFAIVVNRRVKMTNPRLVRASLGASFTMPFIDVDFNDAVDFLNRNNFKILVTDLTAKKSYRDIDYTGRVAIVAGNEHTGISKEWRNVKGAEGIIIPMYGSCESLNVGFASTLVAYESGIRQHEQEITG